MEPLFLRSLNNLCICPILRVLVCLLQFGVHRHARRRRRFLGTGVGGVRLSAGGDVANAASQPTLPVLTADVLFDIAGTGLAEYSPEETDILFLQDLT